MPGEDWARFEEEELAMDPLANEEEDLDQNIGFLNQITASTRVYVLSTDEADDT